MDDEMKPLNGNQTYNLMKLPKGKCTLKNNGSDMLMKALLYERITC